MTMIISMILLAVNILILILDFVFVASMPKAVMYGSLVYVMISTPLLLYLSLSSLRKSINKDVK